MLKCPNLQNKILFHYDFPIHRVMTYLVQGPFNSMYYIHQEYDRFINANFSMHTFHLLCTLFSSMQYRCSKCNKFTDVAFCTKFMQTFLCIHNIQFAVSFTSMQY